MPSLPSIVEDLSALPAALEGYYVYYCDTGRYVLQVDGLDSHPDVVGLKRAHERQKAINRNLVQQVKALSGKLPSRLKIVRAFERQQVTSS